MNKFTPFIVLVVITLLANTVSSADLIIQEIDKGSVIVKELDNSAHFEFNITNLEETDDFEIYSLVSVTMFPKGLFPLPEGQSTLQVMAKPNLDFREREPGLINFEYQLKGEKSGIFKDKLLIKMVKLEDVFEFEINPVSPGDKTTQIEIRNLENTYIENQEFGFSSVFFNKRFDLSFAPFEEKSISIELLNSFDNKLKAGPYIVTVTVPHFSDGQTKFTESIDYLEKESSTLSQDSSGLIIRETVSTKTNTGNVNTNAEIEITKGIVSRLFTTTSPEPTTTERSDFTVTYTWEKSLVPTESLVVTTTTNYTIPFIIILLIILVALAVYFYTKRVLSISKSVSMVRTKGGEFALKVRINVKANKNLQEVNIMDTLPAMTHLFDKFGKKPDKIDHHNRRLTWSLGDLDKGEGRVFSYIIFSKINIVGRFELPAALATFKRDGKFKEAWSNRAFFAKEETD